jgi:signal transduction histidine kinase
MTSSLESELHQCQILLQNAREQIEQKARECQRLQAKLAQKQEELTSLEREFDRLVAEEVRRQTIEAKLCYDLSRQIGYNLSYEDLFRSMLRHIRTAVDCDITGGILLDRETCELFLDTSRKITENVQQEIKERLFESIAKVNDTDLLTVPLYWHDLNSKVPTSQPSIERVGSHFLVPIIADPEATREVIGLLFVGTEQEKQFTETHIRLLYTIANQASIYVQQLKMLLAAEQHKLETEKIGAALAREKELNELKTKIVRIVSHEYRTPLTIVSLAIDLLESQNDKLTSTQKQNCFQQIRNAIQHMAHLVEDAIIVDRAASEAITFSPNPIDIITLCRQVIDEIDLIAKAKCQLKFNYQNCRDLVYLDAQLVKQILINLLSNAIKYSDSGSTIDLHCICDRDNIIFQVCDCGIGIPSLEQTDLFECFHRGTNVGNLPGTGLGLTIVKKCVDLHGGEISVHSKLNVGTTFTVKLPIDRGLNRFIDDTD